MIRVVLLLAALIVPGAAWAQAPLQQSPITAGFWAWAENKTVDPAAIAELCRDKLAIQFSDGLYLGVRLRNDNKPLPSPVIDEIGRCQFNRDTQIERCDLKQFIGNGQSLNGFIESRYSYDADRVLKMSVKVTITSGEKKDADSLDLYPVKCSDNAMLDYLTKADPTK